MTHDGRAAPWAGPYRLRALVLLTAAVLVLHAGLVAWLSRHLPAMQSAAEPRIERIELAFVQDLLPAEPVPVLVAPAPVPRRRAAVAPARAASAADQADGAGLLATTPSSPADLPTLQVDREPSQEHAIEQVPAAVTADSPAAAPAPQPDALASAAEPQVGPAALPTAGAKAFEWPLSTRLSYDLVGDYRGPVQGSAQVEWLRLGSRYQVHLDVSIAGVVSRRLSSEGTLGDNGLRPQRYEEVTKILLGTPRYRAVRFEGDRVILANGRNELALPQVQDTASQFVQLSWLFTTQSHRLKAGELIEVPLALPGRMDLWQYEVQAEDELDLPVGRVRAFRMKPRRAEALPGALLVETWFAPSLQYLPVRIVIHQDAQSYVDLSLSRLPQQAAAPAEPAAR